MSLLPTLFDHAAWADARALDAIRGLDAASAARAQATRLLAHIAAAEHVWLARLEGRVPAHPVWPALSLEEAEALSRESLAGLRAVAAGDARALEREVAYTNSAGQPFRDRVADILAQVALHGSYHRGQLALLARQGGGTPAATDYIAYVRGVPAPPATPDANAPRGVGAG